MFVVCMKDQRNFMKWIKKNYENFVLIKNIIKERYGLNVKLNILDKNPSDHNEMLKFFFNEFKKFKKHYDFCNTNITGGTPAVISSLKLNTVLFFKDNCKIFYKDI